MQKVLGDTQGIKGHSMNHSCETCKYYNYPKSIYPCKDCIYCNKYRTDNWESKDSEKENVKKECRNCKFSYESNEWLPCYVCKNKNTSFEYTTDNNVCEHWKPKKVSRGNGE